MPWSEVAGRARGDWASPLPVATWVMHVGLPLPGLWLLVARPRLAGQWKHEGGHLWLVLASAAMSLRLALRVGAQAHRRAVVPGGTRLRVGMGLPRAARAGHSGVSAYVLTGTAP